MGTPAVYTAGMDTQSTYDAVMAKAGGPVALAKNLGEKPATVCNWKQRGFPADRCKAIEALTGVSVRRLRPDDWRDYWPEQPRKAKAEA